MAVAAPVERPRGLARREALLRAVLRIVGEIGPEAVTHRRVAEVAGLPLASTTYWFSSKDELLAAALELAADADVARLRRTAAGVDTSDDPAQAIVAVILTPVGEALRSSRASLIAAYSLWLEAARRPGLRELATRWTDAYHDAVADILWRAGVADAREDAQLLVATADGLVMDQLARGCCSDLRPRLGKLVAALLAREAPPVEREREPPR
ncbi:MAG: TetR family transcriptional regulator [Actinomycetota bacterium]|nr:TetR family transcriptional regulator [Actinomycetota bacterium]